MRPGKVLTVKQDIAHADVHAEFKGTIPGDSFDAYTRYSCFAMLVDTARSMGMSRILEYNGLYYNAYALFAPVPPVVVTGMLHAPR